MASIVVRVVAHLQSVHLINPSSSALVRVPNTHRYCQSTPLSPGTDAFGISLSFALRDDDHDAEDRSTDLDILFSSFNILIYCSYYTYE